MNPRVTLHKKEQSYHFPPSAAARRERCLKKNKRRVFPHLLSHLFFFLEGRNCCASFSFSALGYAERGERGGERVVGGGGYTAALSKERNVIRERRNLLLFPLFLSHFFSSVAAAPPPPGFVQSSPSLFCKAPRSFLLEGREGGEGTIRHRSCQPTNQPPLPPSLSAFAQG